MHVTGIIAEYNPFHCGHQYQIRRIREAIPESAIIAIMSGSFCQRGQAAMLDKWTRAELAVREGCDLVLELPFVFACRSAQDFARGGIRLLQRLSIVHTLAFGAETDCLTDLQKAAAAIDTIPVQNGIHKKIAAGCSYAAALSGELAERCRLSPLLLRQPNNILAIEYLRALSDTPSIQPLLIQRQGAAYHDNDLHACRASASAIRTALHRASVLAAQTEGSLLISQMSAAQCRAIQNAVPSEVWQRIEALNKNELPAYDRFLIPLQLLMIRSELSELRKTYGIREGLEYRIKSAVLAASHTENILRSAATKRYPRSRIQRLLLYLLLGLSEKTIHDMDEYGPLYARVLAGNATGRKILRNMRAISSIPTVTKTSSFLTSRQRSEGQQHLLPLQRQLSIDTMATELRNLLLSGGPFRNDFQQSPRFFSE
ncbi:tRNA(Met) cytidine acetate ligase [Selenomonas montiformis]|uniref:tRNA(Met) cytidine acetate ligase n=1 Tax=Selenomonas montiformis TaxID=2652285 RepID=UPI003F8AD464